MFLVCRCWCVAGKVAVFRWTCGGAAPAPLGVTCCIILTVMLLTPCSTANKNNEDDTAGKAEARRSPSCREYGQKGIISVAGHAAAAAVHETANR